MPDKKSSGDTTPPEKESGGPKKLIMSVGLCVVLIAIGFVVGGKFSGGAPAAAEGGAGAEAEAEPVEEEVKIGIVEKLEAVNINLAEGRYLRVAVSLGLDAHIELVDSHGKELIFPLAPASDAVLRTFTGMYMEELATAEGREAARVHLMEEIEQYYGHDVVAVFFTEFVMQ